MAFRCAPVDPTQVAPLVVLTGGPGAGKTAVLEVVAGSACEHVVVLPEAASIVFGGGFPRRDAVPARRAAQRAIFHVQRQLERLGRDEGLARLILCDRGTLDGLAYWPGDRASYFTEVGTSEAAELARYHAVIHLRVPTELQGYNRRNPVRTESSLEALAIDDRVADAWRGHPRRQVVEVRDGFVDKLSEAMALIRAEVPPGCREAFGAHAGMRNAS